MAIVKTDVPMTAALCGDTILKLTEVYPCLRSQVLAQTCLGRDIRTLTAGFGPRRVLYCGAQHANEWITTPVILKFMEEFARAMETGGKIFGVDARALGEKTTIYTVPMVNPDGVDLVTGALDPGDPGYERAREISEEFPAIPFPDGWKANLRGVDLNLQYPAGWLRAREIKFSQGYDRPAPRDYVGRAPMDQIESRALGDYTAYLDPDLVIAFHSQGGEIYWTFREYEVPGARELGERMAAVSGYTLAEPAPESSFAGFKDWFIQNFRRPGYTVEVGRGTNPLPLSQFQEIYRDNLGILVTAAMG